MIVKNEEGNIRRCLDSVSELVNEIIIVDTGSTDNTKSICSEYNAKVYDFDWINDFSAARNYALSKSSGDWNLVLDADEYISSFNKKSIRKFISNCNKIGMVKITNFFNHENEIRSSSEYISRLMPKGVLYTGKIHEQIDSSLPREIINIELEHDGYLGKNKFDRNINLLLEEFNDNNKDAYICYQIARTYQSNKMYLEAKSFFEKFYKLSNHKVDAFLDDGIISYINNTINTKDFSIGLELIEDNFTSLQNIADFHFACGMFFMEAILSDFNTYSSYYENIEISYLNALSVGDSSSGGVMGAGSYLAAYNLGLFYEMNNIKDKAIECYMICKEYSYQPAIDRLDKLV